VHWITPSSTSTFPCSSARELPEGQWGKRRHARSPWTGRRARPGRRSARCAGCAAPAATWPGRATASWLRVERVSEACSGRARRVRAGGPTCGPSDTAGAASDRSATTATHPRRTSRL
jgi:hypothetical protein